MEFLLGMTIRFCGALAEPWEEEELEGVDTEEESAEVEVEESQDVSSEETLEYESIMSSRDFRVSIF